MANDSWYNNVLGSGVNIFAAGGNGNTQNLIDSGLLKKDALENAQNQSLTKGLLTSLLSYAGQSKGSLLSSNPMTSGPGGMAMTQKDYELLKQGLL